MLMFTGTEIARSKKGLLTTVACDSDGQPAYALEGSVFSAGSAVQWLRDELGLLSNAAESESIAGQIKGNDGVYLVPAFTGLGAPHWDMQARAAIVGLTRGTGRAHVVRAGLESIAYQTRDVLEVMVAESGIGVTELRVDGGAVANDLLMQFQADQLGVAIDRPQMTETTALGAAFLAGRVVDFWSGAKELDSIRSTDKLFKPSDDRDAADADYRGWKLAVTRVLS